MTGTAKAEPGLGHEVVGREAELAQLHAFLDADPGRAAFLLVGGPGIGKTTLWENGVEAARQRGMRVLVARPSDAEARLAFSSLIDLFDGVASEELAGLPAPQLHALDVALLRAASAGDAPETHAVGVGCLNALRAVAARDADPDRARRHPVARRLVGLRPHVRRAAARGRPRSASSWPAGQAPHPPLELALDPRGVERLELGPLSLGAIRRLLSDRLGLSVSRQLLRRIYDATLGNALFALEVGRKLVDEGPPGIGEDLPVPDAVEDLLGLRVDRLPEGVRRLLLAVALSPDLRVGHSSTRSPTPRRSTSPSRAACSSSTGDHVRASHPLLAAAVVERADAAECRELHRRLAAAVGDGELGARHRALAAARPDATLAADVSAAAARASERGAPQTAVELADHALRLTPRNDPERGERILGLARYLELAGEKQRLTDLLVPALASLPPGEQRVRACLLLASGTVAGNDEIRRFLEQALAESGRDAMSRAAVLAEMAANDAAVRVERIAEAEALALEALSVAGSGRWDVSRAALYALGWARSLGGRLDRRRLRPLSGSCAASSTTSPPRPSAWRASGSSGGASWARREPSSAPSSPPPTNGVSRRRTRCSGSTCASSSSAPASGPPPSGGSTNGRNRPTASFSSGRCTSAAGRSSPPAAACPTRRGAGPRRRWSASPRPASAGTCSNAGARSGHSTLLGHDPGKAVEQLRAGLGAHRARGSPRPRSLPRRTGARRGTRRASASSRRRGVVTARLGELAERAGSSLGARYRPSLRRDPARSPRPTTSRPRPRSRGRPGSSRASASRPTVRGRS